MRKRLGRGGDLTGSYFPEEPPSKIQVPRSGTQDFRGTRQVDIEENNVVSNTSTEIFYLFYPQVTEIWLTVFFVVSKIPFYIGLSEPFVNSFMQALSFVVSVYFYMFLLEYV